jgi:hypothetical protein
MAMQSKRLALLLLVTMLASRCAGQPMPPITLKFVGIVSQGAGKSKTAVLRVDSGPPQYGKEGEIVLGRYRILKIGEDSN